MLSIILFGIFVALVLVASGSFITLLSTDVKIRKSAGLLLCGSVILAACVASALKFLV